MSILVIPGKLNYRHTVITKLRAGSKPFRITLKVRSGNEFEVLKEYLESFGQSSVNFFAQKLSLTGTCSVVITVDSHINAQSIVDQYGKNIVAISEPESVTALDILRTTTDTYGTEIKDHLYWGKYRWAVNFKTNNSSDEITSYINTVFDNSEEQCKFSDCSYSKLYLTDEDGVLTTILALSEYIQNIFKVILREEIYASETCEDPYREECYSSVLRIGMCV